jgi:hypothetical protein
LITWHGTHWFAAGTNLPWIERGCDFGCAKQGVAVNQAEADEELYEISHSGARVVRWYVFAPGAWQVKRAPGTKAPAGIASPVYRDVSQAIELAERYDLSIDFVLFPDASQIPATWIDDATQRAQLAATLKPLFKRFADEDRVLAWELFDEPERAIEAGDVTSAGMRLTVRALAKTVHANSDAQATIGPRSIADLGTWRALGLDFIAPHWFSNMSSGARCAICTTADALRTTYKLGNTPIVIGAVDASSHVSGTKRLNTLYSKGYAGAWTWAAEKTAHPSLSTPTRASYLAMRDFAYAHATIVGPKEQPLNPCWSPSARKLLCPDMKMGAPDDFFASHSHGRTALHQRNKIISRGSGPIELHGTRSGTLWMKAVQKIHRRDGSRLTVATGARLFFKAIPGQYRYWKFYHAARFELWRLNAQGQPTALVRVGPKQVYCLRDLKKLLPRGPRGRVYPGCNQDPNKREVTLGTSVGWGDVYPSTYHQQWIDVTGLRGCFAMVHIADPDNGVMESNERNNRGTTVIRLPWRGSAKGCPGAGSLFFPPASGSY